MDERRRAAWKAAIAKRQRGEEVEEHYSLLRDGMFSAGNAADIRQEALLFLRYWLHGLNIDSSPLAWPSSRTSLVLPPRLGSKTGY